MAGDKLSKAEQINDMVKKARRSIAAANRHLQDGDHDFASSRAYYAALFHGSIL